jgi:carotenoid cleavage dioxygenase-like enzyme
MTIIQFISAFGLGALVTAFVQAWLSQRADNAKRNFQEKKEAYIGFLDAMHDSEIKRCEKSAIHVGHWHNRVELVGSKSVIQACIRIRETNPTNEGVHPDRPQAMRELKEAMRKDLGVQPK